MAKLFRAYALLSAIVTLCAPNLAIGGGEIYFREADYTSLAKCAGPVLEKFHVGGDVHGSYASLVMACIAKTGRADWVLISSTNCYDIDDTETCRKPDALSVPPMAVNDTFWDAEQQRVPFRMEYQLVKWGLGKNCETVRQPVSATFDDVVVAWLCETLEVGDGTIDERTYATLTPDRFALRFVRSEGRAALAPSRGEDGSEQLPGAFVVDPALYTYNYAD